MLGIAWHSSYIFPTFAKIYYTHLYFTVGLEVVNSWLESSVFFRVSLSYSAPVPEVAPAKEILIQSKCQLDCPHGLNACGRQGSTSDFRSANPQSPRFHNTCAFLPCLWPFFNCASHCLHGSISNHTCKCRSELCVYTYIHIDRYEHLYLYIVFLFCWRPTWMTHYVCQNSEEKYATQDLRLVLCLYVDEILRPQPNRWVCESPAAAKSKQHKRDEGLCKISSSNT